MRSLIPVFIIVVSCLIAPTRAEAQASRNVPVNRGGPVPDTLTPQDLYSGGQIYVTPCDTVDDESGKIVTVSGKVALCVDDSHNLYFGARVDSIIWYFRNSGIIGVFIADNLDPDCGYVRIGITQATSSPSNACWPAGVYINWQTDWCERIFPGLRHHPSLTTLCSSSGPYVVVAWIYASDKVCMSEPLKVMIKNPSR